VFSQDTNSQALSTFQYWLAQTLHPFFEQDKKPLRTPFASMSSRKRKATSPYPPLAVILDHRHPSLYSLRSQLCTHSTRDQSWLQFIRLKNFVMLALSTASTHHRQQPPRMPQPIHT
jgi:hypothetical protein